MLGLADSESLRALGYLAVAVAALVAWAREVRYRRSHRELWPTFWLLTAGVLLIMAIGRSSDLGGWISELGRRVARSEGWYAERRRPQAVAIASITVIWAIVVVVSLWRVPERRRRYLPTALGVFTLQCFVAIRLISLHQVDAVFGHDVASVQLGTWAEFSVLLATVLVTLWQPPLRSPPSRAAPSALVDAA